MLTTHQEAVVSNTINDLNESNFVVLEGSAGVGKTFVVNYILQQFFKSNNGKKICSAPTNKAVLIIKDKIDKDIQNVEFSTIHSVLKMRKVTDRKNGNISFKSFENSKYPILKNVKLIVIDEASMINQSILNDIEYYAEKQDTKVLFVGDDKQLNPVNEENSPVFHQDYPTNTLTEIIRQGEGNPIIDISRNIKNVWSKKDNLINDNIGYLYSYNISHIIERLAEVNGNNDLKYLAWTNKEVNKINSLVRKKIYGNPNDVEKEETLIFDTPYMSDNNKIAYYTNEEIFVKELRTISIDFSYPVMSNNITGEFESEKINLQVYCINPGEKNIRKGVVVLHENSKKAFYKMRNKMYKNASSRILEWVDYHKCVGMFAKTKYNHAITVHKSQGSTYKKVVLNVGDMNMNRNGIEKQRLFYTSITRASEMLILYNV